MKFKIFAPLLFFAFFTNFVFASFPVERVQPVANKIENTNSNTVAAADNEDDNASFSAVVSDQKSQGIALVLALTLGLLAAHRWYLGTPTVINIFFIFTLGGIGIWLLVDIIRICCGGMNPQGRYKKSFF
ncbi:TM2 domain-containing protein [Flavobacterium sp.]|uniref:TM2 domain-containing protein n=1 Tax=Flavobacterium sp. TaxID=239 RepID=UPI002CF58EB3|nr:TM2 domain-containing protein [Flavobacterium sp.]HSD06505.1 TM2 domain-containing protein [Flavobacterium sp.]